MTDDPHPDFKNKKHSFFIRYTHNIKFVDLDVLHFNIITRSDMFKLDFTSQGLHLASGILHMKGWELLKLSESAEDYIAEAEYPLNGHEACTHCGVIGQYVRFGIRVQQYHDLPAQDKRVFINVNRPRLKCKACGKVFQQQLPYMDTEHFMTERLVAYIQQKSMSQTFISIAKQIGLDEKSIRLIFLAEAGKLEAQRVIETPEWLGIDEVFLTGKARGIFTDIKGRKPVELLPERKKTAVIEFLRQLDADKVRLVTIDMWNPYREAVQLVLPHATIIIDKFHIVRMANAALDMVRRNTRKQLSAARRRQLKHDRFIMLRRRNELTEQPRFILATWIQNYEKLGRAYVGKEMFCDIWEAHSKDEAERFYQEWLIYIENNDIAHAFTELVRAMTNWHEEIFAYFDYPLTNAYTEALNGILKLIQRNGRGYSFKAIRAKLLYGSTL